MNWDSFWKKNITLPYTVATIFSLRCKTCLTTYLSRSCYINKPKVWILSSNYTGSFYDKRMLLYSLFIGKKSFGSENYIYIWTYNYKWYDLLCTVRTNLHPSLILAKWPMPFLQHDIYYDILQVRSSFMMFFHFHFFFLSFRKKHNINRKKSSFLSNFLSYFMIAININV